MLDVHTLLTSAMHITQIGYYPLTPDEQAAATRCDKDVIGPDTEQNLHAQETAAKVASVLRAVEFCWISSFQNK